MTQDDEHAPSALCVCGDTFLRHGNGDDGGPCQVWFRDEKTGTFTRCDCDQFEQSEDAI